MDAWIFDVDGVLSHPSEKKTTHPEIIPYLIKILGKGDILALNTGRSLVWVEERILNPLENTIQDKTLLESCIAVGEKGNAVLNFENGVRTPKVDTSVLIPQKFKDEVKNLVESKFSESMFFDQTKETMISVEMNDGMGIEGYHKSRVDFIKGLEQILNSQEFKPVNLRIDVSQVSVDIQDSSAGKHLGARRIHEWLISKKFRINKMFMFGDSTSDVEMAEELQGCYNVTFVFVNDKTLLDPKKLTCKAVFTDKKYEEGTAEFLSSQF